MKRLATLLTALLLLSAGFATAADYQYLSQETFREWLGNGKQSIIVDIQVPAEFAKRHFPGALETNAYPVKTDSERDRLAPILKTITASEQDVVIVCPRGGGGAKNTYDYLKAQGIAEKRLFILEKGMEGWPWPELCETGP